MSLGETAPGTQGEDERATRNDSPAQLFVAASPDETRLHTVITFEAAVELGRAPDGIGGAAIADQRLSRRHCRIERREDGSLWVRDLDSRNGVRVNAVKVTEARLPRESVLRIGDTVCTVSPLGAARETGPMIGRSRALASLIADLHRAAPSDVPVLLLGESGTGKELAARHLHEASGRKGRLVSVNCAAIPRDLVESILFGHRKGAFTSAVSDALGAFREAQDGTLFLDEVAELALTVQPKLLRVLEARELMPLGTAQVVPTNARVVAATNAHLAAEVAARAFRDDLYARLSAFTVRLPALRERRVDIALIAARLLAKLEDRRLRASAGFTEALLLHDWPLNVRELRNFIEALALRCEPGTDLRPHHVHEWVALHAVPAPPVDDEERARPTREELEALLEQHGGNVAAVATSLACQRKQLYRWFERYGISPARHRPPRA